VITTQDTAVFTINDTLVPGTGGIAVRVGQTIMLSPKTIVGTVATVNKAIVTSVNTATGVIEVAFYEASGMTNDNVGNIYEMFIYGSEFKK